MEIRFRPEDPPEDPLLSHSMEDKYDVKLVLSSRKVPEVRVGVRTGARVRVSYLEVRVWARVGVRVRGMSPIPFKVQWARSKKNNVCLGRRG